MNYVAKHSKQSKTTKAIDELDAFDIKTSKNVELRRKTFKTTQNYKSDQNTMTCIDLTSKREKQRKTTKVIKLQWIESIWCRKHQNNTKIQKGSIKNELHRFDVKMIKNVEVRRKTFKTTQNYISDQIGR